MAMEARRIAKVTGYLMENTKGPAEGIECLATMGAYVIDTCRKPNTDPIAAKVEGTWLLISYMLTFFPEDITFDDLIDYHNRKGRSNLQEADDAARNG